MAETATSSSCITPWSSRKPLMKFYLFLCVADPWKKRVFWSPSFSHWIQDLWCHIFSSLSHKSCNNFFKQSTSSQLPDLTESSSTLQSRSLVRFMLLWTCPKWSLLHAFNLCLHCFSFMVISYIEVPPGEQLHAWEIVSLHPESVTHMASNLKGFRCHLWCSPPTSKYKRMWRWSNVKQFKCLTLLMGNFVSQS